MSCGGGQSIPANYPLITPPITPSRSIPPLRLFGSVFHRGWTRPPARLFHAQLDKGRSLFMRIRDHLPPNTHAPLSKKFRPGRRRAAASGVVLSSAVLAAVFGASSAFAAQTGNTEYLAADSIPQVIGNVTTWLIGILATLATLILTVGGVRYILAGGDPAEVEKAKTCFKSAAIGYCLAILAPVVVTVLKGLVGG